MTTRNKVITVVALIVASFLIGFIPQYAEARRLRTELDAARVELQLAGLKDAAGLLLTEVLQRNYGVAQQLSSEYFEKLQTASSNLPDPYRERLQPMLVRRDNITGLLATGDPASLPEAQALLLETHEAAR